MLIDSIFLLKSLVEYRKNYTFAADLTIKPYGNTVKPVDMTEKRTSIAEQLESAKAAIGEKLGSKGYVVAGYGGDTYYAFVGEGKGFQGAALTPVSGNPVIFDTEKAAKYEANNGTYRNGRGDVVILKVVEASAYFAKIYADLEKNIELVKELSK